jgi:hypothetical protein
MMRRALFSLAFACLLRGDVTVRYDTKAKGAAILPPAAKEQFEKAAAAAITMHVKGNKGYTRTGSVISIYDLGSQTATIIDDDSKSFASASLAEYQKAVVALTPKLSPETLAMLENMETNLTTRKTGRAEVIGGIRAEEQEIVFTTSNKTTGIEKAGTLSRVVIQIWNAAPGQSTKLPALAELDHFSASSATAMNPSSTIQQMLSGFAGMAKGYEALTKEFNSKGFVLRTRMSVYVPMMADVAKNLAAEGRPVPGYDPAAPLGEVTQELSQMTTTPIAESVFAVPAGYRQTEIVELLKTRFPQTPAK